MDENWPNGAIPLIEPQPSHRAFVNAVIPDHALVKITTARQLLKRGETAASWFPAGTDVITTSTVADRKLAQISWEDELEVIRRFEGNFHVPTDYSTYERQNAADRRANVERNLEGTFWMTRKIETLDLDIGVIPLIKGCTAAEWAIGFETLDRCPFEYSMTAFFATQYFTGGAGIRINELVEDVRTIAARQPRPVMLIGLLSAHYLKRMPRTVRAATGLNQWRDPISPEAQTHETMRGIWADVSDGVREALDVSAGDRYAVDAKEVA
ncbi:hypothetical protein [Halocatena halophila]|uniref:hypothetical protein n=1 Tax=Halocatena halophila TaxID=2814576 RepID=UPI002ED0BFA4